MANAGIGCNRATGLSQPPFFRRQLEETGSRQYRTKTLALSPTAECAKE